MAEAAETEEKKLTPRFDVQDVGPCKLKIHVEVAADKVKAHIDEKYRELNDSVALPGFRKGHAPRNLLERKFGKAMLDDLKFELLNHSFEEVKEEKKLEPVGEPEVADVEKLAVEENKPFAYDVTIEVRPNFEVKSYEGIKVKKPKVTVGDKDVEVVFKGFQESKAELVPAEDGVAKEGDQVIADLALTAAGQEVDKGENNGFFLTPDISFYGEDLPEFHKAIVGHKTGDAVEYAIKLPENFVHKAHAGKDAVIKATLKGVKRKKLPAVDVELAKQFGWDTMDEFTEDVRKKIAREKEARVRAAMGEQIVEELLRSNEFPMPEGLIAAGTEEALRRVHLEMAMQGKPEEEIHKVLDEEKTKSRDQMGKALRSHFILENLAQKEKIFVTEDQVEERIGQMAAQAGRWPHEMKAYLEEQGLLSQLRRRMREELVREFLLSKAVIEEES